MGNKKVNFSVKKWKLSKAQLALLRAVARALKKNGGAIKRYVIIKIAKTAGLKKWRKYVDMLKPGEGFCWNYIKKPTKGLEAKDIYLTSVEKF